MPRKKLTNKKQPRLLWYRSQLAVWISPHVRDVIYERAAAAGTSVSRYVGSWLEKSIFEEDYDNLRQRNNGKPAEEHPELLPDQARRNLAKHYGIPKYLG